MDMLMTELKNEDPTNPVDSTTMIAQEAQFESLSQMQDLNTNLTSMLAMQSVTQSLGLIGYTVTGSDTSGSTVTGQVTGINFVNGSAVLALSVTSNGTTTSDTMNLSSVTAVANK
jgi:flagellar basal-body rod modification protein FlgD